MKKLNITKKQYDESKYFNQKYGALKFVSESGKLYKTDKGVVLALEATEDDEEDKGKGDDEEPKGAEEIDGSEEEVTVKKEDLANALQGVIDTVKDIAADNDVELPGEEGDEEEGGPEDDLTDELDGLDDLGDEGDEGEFEFGEGGEDVCPTCGCKKGSCKKEDECMTTECGGKKPALESRLRRIRRAHMVREAAKRRARAKKVLESIRRRRAAKVLESIRKRRIAKQVLESARKRRLAKRVLESARRRRALKRMMESRKALHPRRVKMMESVRPRGVRRIRRVAR